MLTFLDPRFWIAVVLGSGLIFGSGYFYGEHKQKHLDDLEKTASIAAADREARILENKRQENAYAAAKMAADREKQLLANVSNARAQRDGMRDDLTALQRASEKSISAALEALGLTTQLLDRCTERYNGMAEAAQRADSEARELRQAWPK